MLSVGLDLMMVRNIYIAYCKILYLKKLHCLCYFYRRYISAWSSGVGAIGILASMGYSFLAKISMQAALFPMLIMPFLEAIWSVPLT